MHKTHLKPEFEVISIDNANVKFFAGSPTFKDYLAIPNYEPMSDNSGKWTGNATNPYSTHVDDGGTIDFN